jgi:excinuclease ABC subunit B
VILYADVMTESMKRALGETSRRRARQMEWNAAHGITPTSIKRDISDVLHSVYEQDYVTVEAVEGDATANFVGKDLGGRGRRNGDNGLSDIGTDGHRRGTARRQQH